MSSHSDDRTARAIIRDEALRLFAEHGADAVSVRQIASAAGVSAALVMRHYGSKDGLRAAVDTRVLQTLEAVMGELLRPDGSPHVPASATTLTEAMLQHLPSDSPIPRYLGRMLLEGSAAGRQLFRHILDLGEATLQAMVLAGIATPGADLHTRAAFLSANDLAVLLLREPLTQWLGIDPLSKEGMTRWSREVLAIYAGGLNDTGQPPRP